MKALKKTLLGRWSIAMALVFGTSFMAQAQDTPDQKTEYVYNQKKNPLGFDNYLIATYYYNGKQTFNLRNYVVSETPGTVKSLKVNPSGSSFMLLSQKKDKNRVSVYDLWKAKKLIGEFKNIDDVSAIAYTPDAKSIVLATSTSINFYDARTYQLQSSMDVPFKAKEIAVSPNNYSLAATDGSSLTVWNLETKTVRKEFTVTEPVNRIVFSDDSKIFAVLTADGLMSTYDTQSFLLTQSYDAMGNAIACAFHPNGKYVAVVCSNTRIAIVNLMDNTSRSYIDNEVGGITDVRFVNDPNGSIFMVYNTAQNITYKLMSELAPNYTKLLADELNEKMNEWMKQMPNESLEEYRLRVNEDTRMAQMRLFEQEIATRMADNLISMSDVSLGNYSMESNMLAINFDNMPPIYLEVPSTEVNDFMDPQSLEFQNTKYGLTKNDKFELIYADVHNRASGKTYVYNNLERRSLEYLKLDEEFVPLAVIQQSNMQEFKLQEIRENVISMAKESNTISDHTHIAVKTNVVSSTDADGSKIMNYVTDFSYTVEAGFSGQEDFGPGKYKVEQSGAALSMLAIIQQAFEGEFAPYVKSGKKLQVKVTGMADALPINGKIPYDGCYGDYTNEPVYKNNDLGSISVTKAEGITQNEQLAFLRALGVKDYISNNIAGFSTMHTDYKYHIEVTSGKGGEFRRISVQLTFVDAF